MTRIIRKESRRRGFFGWIFLLIFIGFNLLMAFWLFSIFAITGEAMETAASNAEQAGSAIGGTVASGLVMGVWAFGAVITGVLALMTRGKLTVIEERVE